MVRSKIKQEKVFNVGFWRFGQKYPTYPQHFFKGLSTNKTLRHLGLPNSGFGVTYDETYWKASGGRSFTKFCEYVQGSQIESLDFRCTPHADSYYSNRNKNLFQSRARWFFNFSTYLPNQIKTLYSTGNVGSGGLYSHYFSKNRKNFVYFISNTSYFHFDGFKRSFQGGVIDDSYVELRELESHSYRERSYAE